MSERGVLVASIRALASCWGWPPEHFLMHRIVQSPALAPKGRDEECAVTWADPAALARRTVLGLGLAATMLARPLPGLAAAEKKKGGGVSFIQFPALTSTVRRSDGGRGVLSIEAGVDVPDPELHKRADASQPVLRDAYVRWLTIYAAALSPEAPPNPDQIAAEFQRITDRVLGRPGARFLIGTLMVN